MFENECVASPTCCDAKSVLAAVYAFIVEESRSSYMVPECIVTVATFDWFPK